MKYDHGCAADIHLVSASEVIRIMRWIITRGTRVFLLALLSVLVVLPNGCGDDTEVPERRIYTVTYSLNVTGESSVDQIIYVGGGQDIVFDNPTNGWSVQIPGADGQLIGAIALGTVKNGAIIMYMSAEIAGEAPITGEDECSESAGVETICSLDIPMVRLP